MIFKQVREIIEGKKTQTRRIVKKTPHEVFCEGMLSVPHAVGIMENHRIKRIKWQVGRKYAVVPGRAKPQVYYRYRGIGIYLAHEIALATTIHKDDTMLNEAKRLHKSNWERYLKDCGYKPLTIEITNIRCESLQDITEQDAIAEGVQSQLTGDTLWFYGYDSGEYDCKTAIDSYKSLWESINGKKSWAANPDVWVLEFKVAE